MSSPRPIFHIGANKAGSTTLQQALFVNHPEVLSLGKPSYMSDPGDAGQAVDAIRDACEVGAVKVGEPIKKLWRRALDAAPEKVPVYSHEELIRTRYYPASDPSRMPRAIVEMAGPVRVVIVTREQIDLLESLYIHKANISTYLPPDRWLAANADWISTFRFHEVANAWASAVGEENVGVFLFEELARDTASFAARLANFIGVDAEVATKLLSHQHKNARKSRRTQAYVKLRSALLPRASLGGWLPEGLRNAWRGYLDGGAPSKESLPEEWIATIRDGYRGDNRKLAERFQLPLEKYKYPL